MALSLEGLLGNPAFQSGMGLLSAGYNRTINPWQAANQGLLGAQNFQDQQSQIQFKQRQQAALENAQQQLKTLYDPRSYQIPGKLAGQEDPLADVPASVRQTLGVAAGAATPQNIAADLLSLYKPTGSAGHDATRIQYWHQYQQLQKDEASGAVPPGTAEKFLNTTMAPTAVNVSQGGAYTTRDPITHQLLFGVNPNTVSQAGMVTDAEKTASVNAEKQTVFQTQYPDVINAFNNHLQGLQYLRDQMSKLNTGPLFGNLKAKLMSEYQTANAANASQALQTMGDLKAMGVSLTPMSEQDRKVIFDTSSQMSNDRDANVKILDRAIKVLQKNRAQVNYTRNQLLAGKKLMDIQPLDSDEMGNQPGLLGPATAPHTQKGWTVERVPPNG